MNEETVKVWSLPIRVFHWSLVILFALAWFTAEEFETLHSWFGYVISGLLVFRIIYGFVGAGHARFRDFVYSPKRVLAYLTSLRTDHPEHYYGHNPAGGLMVILLLINLLVICWTGLEAWGAEGHGPLASQTHISLIDSAQASAVEAGVHNEEEEMWEERHELAANLMLFFILVHISGVVVSSRLHKENLVKAMVTGHKPRQK